ncbi:hypothetical protein DSM104299_03116 [Baekduia alba]|uniref:hypothetical protein n=1 Tax=Baekduia alba TaxID=2997333 RepID=UPI00233FC4DB|nr:hypothetical protein [Baekduia alba]WCB94382.1 hypothetical protein DSM104299_03116 [Baekduia alba]
MSLAASAGAAPIPDLTTLPQATGAAATGRIWFVSKQGGKVGVLDPKTKHIGVLRTGKQIENSFAVDRDAVYIVSDRRMYWFSYKNGKPRVDWPVAYENSGIHESSQVDAVSGTTPTIVSGGYVAIADNADPMNVVVYRTAIKPMGKRTVCAVPVFAKGAGATENWLIGSGRSLIVQNKYAGIAVAPDASLNVGVIGGLVRLADAR